MLQSISLKALANMGFYTVYAVSIDGHSATYSVLNFVIYLHY